MEMGDANKSIRVRQESRSLLQLSQFLFEESVSRRPTEVVGRLARMNRPINDGLVRKLDGSTQTILNY